MTRWSSHNAFCAWVECSPSKALVVALITASIMLFAWPIVPQFFSHGKSMDYPLWFSTGQQVLHGEAIYQVGADGNFEFMYTPFAAVLLAIPSYFGMSALVVTLSCATLFSWWVSIVLANRLAAAMGSVPAWIVSIPIFVTLPFVYDQFHLGQPNLFLLALMLGGFSLLSAGHKVCAGLTFATAAAIKVFPILVLPYLVWRREWLAVVGTIVGFVFLILVVPAAVRGFDRNCDELKFWMTGMLFSGRQAEFAQRPDSYGWKNQSLYAVEHRLLRPIDAENKQPGAGKPLYVNILELEKGTVDKVFFVTELLMGLLLVLALPRLRTRQSDVAEFGIVLTLIVIASLMARSYYFVWLLFPYTVITRWLVREYHRNFHGVVVFATAFSVALMAVGINVIQPHYPQALGCFLWAALVIVLVLSVIMRRESLAQS